MIDSLKKMIINMIYFAWPMVVISIVILTSLRIVYLIKNKERFILYKELSMLFFVVYILSLFQVVTFQDVSWSGSNFTLFKEILRYKLGTKLFYRNILGNMVLFLPYGFFASYYLKLKKTLPAFILIIVASLSIEVTQLVIGRVFDVDDIFLNILGGLFGYYLYHVLDVINKTIPKALKKEWFLNLLAILLVVGMGCAFLLWNIKYITKQMMI